MINKLVRVTLAVALLSFGTTVFAGIYPNGATGNLVMNGGFETGDFTDWMQFGDTSFNGVCMAGTCPLGETPFDGTYSAFFGPVGDTGGIYQNITTVPGDLYTISFYLALPDVGTPNSFEVQFGTSNFVLTNFPGSFQWTQFVITDMATSTSTRLTFTFRNDPNYWFLDDVSVTTAATTPEPGTLVLFGSGIIGMAGVIRRKFRA